MKTGNKTTPVTAVKPTMKKRILHVIDNLGRGGAETLLVGIIKALPDVAHEVVMLNERNEFKNELPQGLTIHCLRFTKKYQLLTACFRLRQIIKTFNPHIVHSHLYWSNVITRLSTPKETQLFFSNHCMQSFEAFKNPLLVHLEKLTYHRHHTLISVSQAVEEDYKKYIPIKGKTHVLHNFVEDRFFRTASQTGSFDLLRCVGVGRMTEQKNWGFLVQAFSRLKDEEIYLDIYGQGPLLQTYQQQCKELGLKKLVFKGVNEQLFDLLPTYDLFVSCSLYEGHPVSVLEAMAAGLPLLLSDIPVMYEAAKEAAFYFNLDDEMSFIKQIVELKNNRHLLNLSAMNAKALVHADYTKKKYIESLLNIYHL